MDEVRLIDPNEKGRELEIAVEAIEAVILESSPSLVGQPFQIERRKRINVGDVQHEIDIFVRVGAAKGYESTFIFECKNWEAPVGKNEIIVFSEKIDATVAQRGYVVAKGFTKDAFAQAAKDPRLTTLYAIERDPANTAPPEGFHITVNTSAKPDTVFRVRGSSGAHSDPIDVNGKMFAINGKDLLVTDYLNSWIQQLYRDRLLWFQTAHLVEGIHPMLADEQRSFDAGECVIDGRDIEHVRLFVEFGVQVIRPVVISDFELATRGRVVRLARVAVRDLVLDTTFVTALNN
jgi:hypothetical protein